VECRLEVPFCCGKRFPLQTRSVSVLKAFYLETLMLSQIRGSSFSEALIRRNRRAPLEEPHRVRNNDDTEEEESGKDEQEGRKGEILKMRKQIYPFLIVSCLKSRIMDFPLTQTFPNPFKLRTILLSSSFVLGSVSFKPTRPDTRPG